MSDVKQLGVAHGLDLLDRLHRTLADFKKEEGETARRLRERRYAAERASSEALEGADRVLVDRIADAEADFASAKTHASEIHSRRRTHIRSLVNTGIRNLPRRAREEGERWLGGLQMGHFTTSRRLQSERESAEAKREQLQGTLARRDVALRTLEKRMKEYFLGYPGFLHGLRATATSSPSGDWDELFSELEDGIAAAKERLAEFRRLPLPRIFGVAPLWAVIPLVAVCAFLFVHHPAGWIVPALITAVAAGALFTLHAMGRTRSKPAALAATGAIVEARALLAACHAEEAASYEREIARIEHESTTVNTDVDSKWERAEEIKTKFEEREKNRFEKRGPRAIERNDRIFKTRMARIEAAHAARVGHINSETGALRGHATNLGETSSAMLAAEEDKAWRELETRWHAEIEPLYAAVAEMNAGADSTFPPWTQEYVENWRPRTEFLPATKFARLDVDIPPGVAGSRLRLPGPDQVSIPLALAYPGCGSLLFEVDGPVGASVISCLNQIILRLLATTPPAKLSFTIIDPVGLGQNFAGLMHLGDYEESLISRRIWTQSDQIEARLAELNQHIEKIIQMYLRDEYPTIVEYNEQAGSTAEKYHFLVVADFPANFSETAVKRLQSIITSGPRCGVYTFVHWDKRQPMPSGFVADELRTNSVCIQGSRSGLVLESENTAVDARLVLDPAPATDVAIEFIEKVGTSSTEANQVQVPFEAISPQVLWQGDTTNELRIAVGRTGATKQQMLAIGKGTRQHALLAGKTGSGKSTLLHVIITNLALTCSPEQVEFYLIDFKKGVEFKCYAEKKLPHAKVVAIESDREFGLSVLQRVDDELRRRGDLFRKLGVQDVAGYKREGAKAKPDGGLEPMPRTMLIIDEFQELFVEDDSIAQSASVLLDRIVRQGRAFGIHVLLGSQTLGGAYSLARATLGQMVIRIALQCNEADSYLIMDDNNPAPRLLSRPGEGIYNDSAGVLEGNSPFQVCWLPEDERDRCLDKIRAEAERHPEMDATPIVFEGNAPANIGENALLAHVLQTRATKAPVAARAWIGAPNSIKGPTELVFHRQSGSNLLVVGQRDEAALAMLGNSLLALAAQYPAGSAKFVFLHSTAPGSADLEFIEGIVESVSHPVTVATGQHIEDVLKELHGELKQRADGVPGAQEIYFFVHGLQRFKKLRHEDDFDFSMGGDEAPAKPGAQFAELVAEGATNGIHVLTSVDTLSSVNRFFNRKALGEFEMRVVFQMSANDSASLIDSPKGGNLGLHRALYYNEREGSLETFRPYATPDVGWLEKSARPAATPA
ncbi:MAG: FtsK/SpoIIIE domain-containing protein [Chthoniobacterales bacterium]